MDVSAGQKITIIDIEGGQVVDFFAERMGRPEEFLSRLESMIYCIPAAVRKCTNFSIIMGQGIRIV